MTNWKLKNSALRKYFNAHILPQDRRPIREFRSPAGYLPHAYLHCLEQISFLQSGNNDVWREIGIRSFGMQDLSIDPHYLSGDLLQDLYNTDFPDQINHFQNVTPLLRVFLPLGTLLDDTGDSIVLLIVEDYPLWEEMERDLNVQWKMPDRTTRNSPVLEYMNEFKSAGVKQCRFAVHAITEHGAAFRAPIEEDDIILAPLEGIQYISNGQVDAVLDALKRIGLNLLLLLQSHPEYIKNGFAFNLKSNSGCGFGSSSKNHLLQPRCIEADINTRLEVISNLKSQGKITKPKSRHLRRGHWRRQRTGAGLSSHQFIWIKPVIVNHD